MCVEWGGVSAWAWAPIGIYRTTLHTSLRDDECALPIDSSREDGD